VLAPSLDPARRAGRRFGIGETPPLIPAGLSVVQVLPAPDRVTIVTVPTSSEGACPLCGGLSGRVHSRYTRTLADLPWQGRAVAVRVRARRFRCATAGCPRRIFTERLINGSVNNLGQADCLSRAGRPG
jgi:transposase IS204/IS1001/IS1096/IS1165 family protein